MAQIGPLPGIILKQARVYTRVFWFGQTGQTLVVNLSKNGAAFASTASPVSEIANGWYSIALSITDTGTAGDLAYHITGGANLLDFCDTVQPQLFTDLALNAAGQPLIASSIKQNQALNGFTFVMRAVGTNAPATGLTVTAQRSLGGAGFANCANSPATELSNGVYKINLANTDLNSPTVMLLLTAPGANNLYIPILTSP